MVAVRRPRKYPKREQWKYESRYQVGGRGIPCSASRAACAFLYASYLQTTTRFGFHVKSTLRIRIQKE
jgi:hypothetical protein